jgi:hypothetical protein
MPVRDPLGPGLVLVGVLLVLAVWFAALQWRERRGRPPGLPPADARYFGHKDIRRLAGSLVMLLMAGAMGAGLWLDPRAGQTERRLWAAAWLAVMALVWILLGLGLWDWLALRRYAYRARHRLDLERRQAAAEFRRLRRPPDGSGTFPQAL